MTKDFWKDTGYRCAWTFAQALLAFMAVGQAIEDVHWTHALSVACLAAFICLIKQIGKYAKEKIKADKDDDFVSEVQTTFNDEGERMFEEMEDENQNRMSEEE